MSLARDFAKSVGGKIAHVTARTNLDGMERNGLRSAADIARRAGKDPRDLVLRKTRVQINDARLNHQKPILHGLAAAARILDGHTPESWAEQLDARIFFWPAARGAKFANSIQRDVDISTIWLDAERFAHHFVDHIDLCALNSGNFTQGGAHAARGDWIYRPLRAGLAAFRTHRRDAGLVKSTDSIAEISLRCAVSATDLADLRVPLGDPFNRD